MNQSVIINDGWVVLIWLAIGRGLTYISSNLARIYFKPRSKEILKKDSPNTMKREGGELILQWE